MSLSRSDAWIRIHDTWNEQIACVRCACTLYVHPTAMSTPSIKLDGYEKRAWKHRIEGALKKIAKQRAAANQPKFEKSSGGRPGKGDVRAGLDVECHRRFKSSVANLPDPQQTLRSANNDRHRVVAVIEIAEALLKERVALWVSAGMPADYIVADQAAADQPPAEQPAPAQTDSPEILVPATQDNVPVVFVPETPMQSVTGSHSRRDDTVANTPGADDLDAHIASRQVRHSPSIHPATCRVAGLSLPPWHCDCVFTVLSVVMFGSAP